MREVAPPALLVFVGTDSGRLLPITPGGRGEEVAVETDVPPHHKQGGRLGKAGGIAADLRHPL